MARSLAQTGVHPNVLTIFSLFPALAAGIVAADGNFVGAALLLLFSGVFDLLDGALARAAGKTSRFGALLDSTLDRLSDVAIPIGLILFYAPHGAIVLIPAAVIVVGYTISYVRARAEGLSIELPRLWMRREDRLALVVIALFLSPVSVPGIPIAGSATLIVLALLAVLGFIAVVMALLAAAQRS